MTAVLLRLLVYAIIIGIIFLGLRKIWRDWTSRFRTMDKARRERDLEERARPDVIELKRDQDGVYRPPSRSEGE